MKQILKIDWKKLLVYPEQILEARFIFIFNNLFLQLAENIYLYPDFICFFVAWMP